MDTLVHGWGPMPPTRETGLLSDNGAPLVELLGSITYLLSYNGEKFWLSVPKGRITDLGSVPGFARSFVSHFAPWNEAYILHDELYACRLTSRYIADGFLFNGMRKMGANRVERNLAYGAVRVGGWKCWGRHTIKSVTEHRALLDYDYATLPIYRKESDLAV